MKIMKTKLNLGFSIMLLFVLLLSNLFAQKDFTNQSAFKYPSSQSGVTFPSPENNLMTKEVVSEKVLKHFNKTFKNAESIKWEQLDDNFLATFVRDHVTTKSLFDKKGNVICMISYSSEKKLPVYIKSLVTNNYRNYAITSVANILQDNRKIWIIKLEGKSNYAAVRIENDEIDEIENFQKVN